jgi:glutamine amidotransferase
MIVIIKYNAGNIKSVQNALTRLGYQSVISDDPEVIRNASKVIFPGVGEASSAMNYLKSKGLDQVIISLKQPVMGICLGQQLLCSFSEEGNTKCLGIFDCEVKLFPPEKKVPHMGWNDFTEIKGALFQNLKKTENVYYVHSYYCELTNNTTAVTDYIVPFGAAMNKNNFYACQFHPEKSASVGEKIMKNFLEL